MAGPRKNQSRRGRRRRPSSREAGSAPDDLAESQGRGTAPGRGYRVAELCELSPLSAFCALYLGITEDDGYQQEELPAVAKRFGLSEEAFQSYLEEVDLAPSCVRESSFDLESAQLDIKVAPQGVSRIELARSLFEEYQASRRL